MKTPAILSIATDTPQLTYSQGEILENLNALGLGNDPRTPLIFANSGVAQRHAVIEPAYFNEERTTQVRNECYLSEALPLGQKVILDCLDAAGYRPADVDYLTIVSCTGIDTPGLDLQLAGRLGMRPDLRRTSILGMGCYGAFPGLLRAREAVTTHNGLALVLTLELCSLHLQMDDTLENMVSAALFADGAAAALIGVPSNGQVIPHLIDSATYCDYTTLEHMAFHLTDHGFQMRLSAYVPDLLAAQITDFIDDLLQRNELQRDDVRFWGVHPGSGKILDHVQSQLDLTNDQMDYSRAILRDYGNMSSATVLFILDEMQRRGKPEKGDYGVLMAFGPGLTMESMLIQW